MFKGFLTSKGEVNSGAGGGNTEQRTVSERQKVILKWVGRGSSPVHMKGDSPGQDTRVVVVVVVSCKSYKSRQNKFILEGETAVTLAGGGVTGREHDEALGTGIVRHTVFIL